MRRQDLTKNRRFLAEFHSKMWISGKSYPQLKFQTGKSVDNLREKSFL